MKLKNWAICYTGDEYTAPEARVPYMIGNVYGSTKFEDGIEIRTSRIVDIVDCGTHKEVHTRSGSVYEIYRDEIDSNLESEFPNYYDRIKFV